MCTSIILLNKENLNTCLSVKYSNGIKMLIRQLEQVIKVAECGSITKASQQLYISQPSLSKSISNLEDKYNIKIFLRTPKGITITPDGKEFIYYARNIVNSSQMMNEVFKSPKINKRSVLSIACQQLDFLHPLLLKLYQTFAGNDFHLNVYESNRSDILSSILNGDNNIGIMVISSSDSKAFCLDVNKNMNDLEIHILGGSGVYVSMGPKSSFYSRKHITFEELEDQFHVVLDMENEAIENFYFEPKKNHINKDRVLFTNSINCCIKFLLETDAHLYSPIWVLNFFKDLSIHSIRVQETENSKIPVNNLVLIKRKNETMSEIESIFFELLKNKLKK